MAPRYLIVGASGLVGAQLYATLGPGNAMATWHRKPVPGGVAFDAVEMRLADTVLKRHPGFTHAFVFHGISGIDDCARDPQGTARVNVASVCAVIDDLVDHGIVPVFASSDAVFDGTRGMWTEEDPVNPVLTYGRHKVEVERYLAAKSAPSLVVRLAKVVSGAPGAGGLVNEWLDQLECDADIRCATDQFFSPADVDDVVRALVGLAEGRHTGVFHVCGPRPLSRLEFLRTVADEARRYRPVPARIVPCSLRDFDFAEPRPLDASMSLHKLYAALGGGFDDMSVVCARAAAQRYAKEATLRASGRAATTRG